MFVPGSPRLWTLGVALVVVAACTADTSVGDLSGAAIDPPQQCSPSRPDWPVCSIGHDYPDNSDLNAQNSAGVRFSAGTNSLIIDRATALPDGDGDGVPDDADDCPTDPGWRLPCDGDPSDDGIYETLFYDILGTQEVVRSAIAPTTADIPAIDVYFLIDATSTMAAEIGVLRSEIALIIDDIQARFDDAQFGLGLYRDYPVAPVAGPYSQSPFHHILDITGDSVAIAMAVSTLNTVDNLTEPEAASQALFSVATGQGLGEFVPNRGSCPATPANRFGYPCFRPDVLHVVMNITDAAMYNGPRFLSPTYPPFPPGMGPGVTNLPPAEMFPQLIGADDAATALDLGDLSAQSLTLLGMSTLLTNKVNTAVATGCQTQSGMPPGDDMDDKDAVITFRFDSPAVTSIDAFANNTHWPGANVAVFTDAMLDPTTSIVCDGGTIGVGSWGSVSWTPATGQQYYVVADGILPAADLSAQPEGAFSLSIRHDGDPSDASWLTKDAPVPWSTVQSALLASEIRVASVVTLKDPMTMPSDGKADADRAASITNAVTKLGDEWVNALPSSTGEGLDSAIVNTIDLVLDESVYDFHMVEVDNASSPGFDETDFVISLGPKDCAEGATLECASRTPTDCQACDVGAILEFELLLKNDSVPPTTASQVFDFEIVVWADGIVEVERIPVRVMVPDDASHVFDGAPGSSFYRNTYDSLARCDIPPERPDWGNLTWTGSTPGGSSIEFQIRSANTAAELDLAVPAVVLADPLFPTIDVGWELINTGIPNGLPFIRITALLHPSPDLLHTPQLAGWDLDFTCFAAE